MDNKTTSNAIYSATCGIIGAQMADAAKRKAASKENAAPTDTNNNKQQASAQVPSTNVQVS
ncbi:MAG: hypothetical protein WCG84_02990 [Candidatus Moraniibacteriota bacterium]